MSWKNTSEEVGGKERTTNTNSHFPIFPFFLFSYFSKKQRKNSVESVGSGPQKQRVQKFFFYSSFVPPTKKSGKRWVSFILPPPPPPRNPHFPLLLFIIVMGRAHHLLILSPYYKPRHQRGHTSIQKRWGGAKSIRVGNSTGKLSPFFFPACYQHHLFPYPNSSKKYRLRRQFGRRFAKFMGKRQSALKQKLVWDSHRPLSSLQLHVPQVRKTLYFIVCLSRIIGESRGNLFISSLY